MKITAKDIARWTELREAQGSLPRLVRRLGDAVRNDHAARFSRRGVRQPARLGRRNPKHRRRCLGTQGQVMLGAERRSQSNHQGESGLRQADEQNAGGCSTQYHLGHRYRETLEHKKKAWRDKKIALGEWQSVRAYDADDLEAWLEASPAIALDFADELGLTGDGVESASHYWRAWASQSAPPIRRHAFFADRQDAKDRLLVHLRERIDKGDNKIYAIRADSVDEAAAFVCAALLDASDLLDVALVVTSDGGWRFVEKQPRIKLVVAARPEVATRIPVSSALVVVPVAAGDLASGYGGKDGTNFDLVLERPGIYPFRDALIENGIEESDAQRLARSAGRSWTVLRRRLGRKSRDPSPRLARHVRVRCTVYPVPAWCLEYREGRRPCRG